MESSIGRGAAFKPRRLAALLVALALLAPLAVAARVEDAPQELSLSDGSVDLSRAGNLLRRRFGLTIDADYAALKVAADARRAALRSSGDGPVVWKVALTIVESLLIERQPAEGAPGDPSRLEVAMTPEESLHCLRVFLHWAEAVHVLTAGEIEVQYTVRFLDGPVSQSYRDTFFFVPTQGMPEFSVEPGSLDSVVAFFKPGAVPTSMYGGTHGGDLGPGGAASSGLALIPERETSEWSFADTTMHEWLHQIEWANSSILGYRGLPGTHDFPGLGYASEPDPYLVHRDFMRFVVTPGMWRKLSIRRAAGRTEPSAGIKDWLVLGPFDNADDQALGREILPEAAVTPDAEEAVSDRAWALATATAGFLDLAGALSPSSQVVAYAHAYVFSPEESPALLALGADDGSKVFLNGLLVFEDHSHHAARKDATMVKVLLQKGWNRLLVKVDQGVGAWGIYARLLDLSLRPMPEIQYAARRPSDGVVSQGRPYEKTPYALRYYSFDQIQDDPWFKLPRIDGERLADILGVPGVEIHAAERHTLLAVPKTTKVVSASVLSTPDPSNETLDNQLTWDRESCLHLRYRNEAGEERDLIGIRPDVAEVFLRHFRSISKGSPKGGRRPEESVIGYLLEGAKPVLLVETALPEPPRCELDLLCTRSARAELFAAVESERIHRGGEFRLRCDVKNLGTQSFTAVSISVTSLCPGISVLGEATEVKGIAAGQAVSTEYKLQAGTAMSAGPAFLRARAVLCIDKGDGTEESETIEKLVALRIDEPIEVRASLRGLPELGIPVLATREQMLDVTLSNRLVERVSAEIEIESPPGWSMPSTDGNGQPTESSLSLEPESTGRLEARLRLPDGVADGDSSIRVTARVPGAAWPATTVVKPVRIALGPTLSVQSFESDLGSFALPLDAGFNGAGAYRVSKETASPLSGAASVRVEDQGGAHYGHVHVFGSGPSGSPAAPVYNTKDFPFIEFLVRTESDQPTALLVTVDRNVTCAMLTGGYCEQWERRLLLPPLPFKPSPEPTRVVYSLDEALDKALGKSDHFVTRIDFGDPRAFVSNPWTGPDVKVYWFDDFTIRR